MDEPLLYHAGPPLEKEMEAGEYPLTVQYATFTADEEMAPQNGAEVNCTLVVR